MKKVHLLRSLMLVLLIGTVILGGCGSKEEFVEADSLSIGTKLQLNRPRPYSISMRIFDPARQIQWELEGGIKYCNNILEDVELATVSDGTYSITLGMDFGEILYEEELQSSDDEWVTPIWYYRESGGSFPIYAVVHLYDDIKIYSGEYNPINGDYAGFHDYVLEVVFLTPRFSNADGVKVGMTEAELTDIYKEGLYRRDFRDGSYELTYDDSEYIDMWFQMSPEGILEEMAVLIRGTWWDVNSPSSYSMID